MLGQNFTACLKANINKTLNTNTVVVEVVKRDDIWNLPVFPEHVVFIMFYILVVFVISMKRNAMSGMLKRSIILEPAASLEI